MSRALTALCSRVAMINLSKFSFPHSLSGAVPTSSLIVPPNNSSNLLDDPQSSTGRAPRGNEAMRLPAIDNPRQVYTFPTANRQTILDPPLSSIIGKCDPTVVDRIEAPSAFPIVGMYAAPRLLTIRRKKMKKHKRRRRYDRDFFKYQKYHREKKLKSEREFIRRMKACLAELHAFNPEEYVEKTIADAKKEWSDDLAPTGRKLHPHWSRLMSLEELYGLPKDDYIDKRAGIPDEEDLEKIKELKQDYENKYRSKGNK